MGHASLHGYISVTALTFWCVAAGTLGLVTPSESSTVHASLR